jgi:hypothetical protein
MALASAARTDLQARTRPMARKRLTPKQLEDLYDSGDNRVTQERSDFLLPQIVDFVRQKKWLNLRPEYQRRLVWDEKKKSLFIESLLMNIPVPPVFLYETDLSRYEVMDGQQRLNAILEFYENNLKLRGLETWSALNGYTYSKCPPRIQRGLDRRRISATVLLAENREKSAHVDSIRREVFERLNTGGLSLNPQELRNSLYSGDFNDLIIELAGYRLFDEVWGIPPYEDHYRRDENFISPQLATNEYFKRMKDCEIVLRFFALRESSKIKGSIRRMLDKCMEENMESTHEQLDAYRQRFIECLEISHETFGDKTFRVKNEKKWELSIPLFDGVMIAAEALRKHRKELAKAGTKILRAFEEEFANENSYEIIVGKPNTADAVKARLALIHKLMKKFI